MIGDVNFHCVVNEILGPTMGCDYGLAASVRVHLGVPGAGSIQWSCVD